MFSKIWIIITFVFYQNYLRSEAKFQSFRENPKGFCIGVPPLSSIKSYNKCPTAKLFTRPLQNMRECCDLGLDDAVVKCLEGLRTKEQEVVNLFLKWKEPEHKDTEYMKNLEYCRETYKKIQVQSRGCANKFDPRCVDPIGFYQANCTNANSVECKEGFTRAMRKGALASFCMSNSSAAYETYEWESVHHRCFSPTALNRRYHSVMNDVREVESYCVNELYGAATNWNVYEELQIYKGFALFENMIMDSNYGVYEAIETQAEVFLPELCHFSSYNDPLDCLQTPVTQTYLTFKSKSQVASEVRSCCDKNKPATMSDTDEIQGLKTCLSEENLFQQFYQLGGLFMRGLKRAKTGYISECVRDDADTDPGYRFLKSSVVTKDYAHELYPNKFEQEFRNLNTMNPITYHFFLRDLAETMSMSDEYYKAACEACAEGEKWGKQAYVYPGLTCPALAAKKYYEPILGMKTCPDMLFYKYQVAHYCCLDSAFEKFNFGSNYDPKVCPDMLDAKETKSQ